MRKSFADILKSAQFNVTTEYYRLKTLFYERKIKYFPKNSAYSITTTLHDLINSWFALVSFRNNALSLDDFDRANGFSFSDYYSSVDIDHFVTFCEYLENIILDIRKSLPPEFKGISELIFKQIHNSIEKICYMELKKDDLISYVPTNAPAITVAEIIEDDDLSYNTIFYNHHSLSGDLEGKKEILLKFANLYESRKSEAKGVCDKVAENLSYAFNNFNIRHNNIDSSSKSYQESFAKLSDSEKEELYDDTYQLCLEFFIALDNKDKIKKFEDMRKRP
ncbi:MAG: hypothetical protein IIW49_02740 [Treponema sp.]|nr:hypothetical protein [Treponema sp.]